MNSKFRAGLAGIVLATLAGTTAKSDEIVYKVPVPGGQTETIVGRVLKEVEENGKVYVRVQTSYERVAWVPKQWIVSMKIDPTFKFPEEVALKKALEPSQRKEEPASEPANGIKEGQAKNYFTIATLVNQDNVIDTKNLPELTLEDLRKITMLPELTVGPAVNGPIMSGGKNTFGEIRPLHKSNSLVEGRNGYILTTDITIIDGCPHIKHFTNESINGITYPKDLVLLPPRMQKRDLLENTIQKIPVNRTFANAANFPQITNCIIGKFNSGNTEYVVADGYLLFREHFEAAERDHATLQKSSINYYDFQMGYRPVELWREYVNLRGKNEKEIEAFHKNNVQNLADFKSKKVKLGNLEFCYVAAGDAELSQAEKTAEIISNATGEGIGKNFADLVLTGKSEKLENLVKGKEKLSDVLGALNEFFKGKMVNGGIDDWHIPIDKLMDYKKHDCDTSAKIAANALRAKGFPANIMFVGGARWDDPRTPIGHFWTEIYLPKENVVVSFDLNDPSRNYIFKADSKQKMKYLFDKYGKQRNGEIFQLTFSQAFDL